MPLPRRPNRGTRSIVASAYRVGGRDDSDFTRRKALPWQQQALEYIDLVPELNFASRFYPRMLKPLRIYPAMLDEHEQLTEIKEGLPLEALNRIQDPGGGKSQILGSYGRLMFITGEGILFGRDLNTERERWSFVWNNEITVDSDGKGNVRKIIHELGGGVKREYGPDQAVAYRMWTPHPRNSNEAESPMRASLEIAEELIILTKSVRSTAVSRLVKGLLFMPSEISPAPAEPSGDEDPLNDPWSADYIEHAETQIENPGTAEAAMPLTSWVGGEYISMIRHIQVHDPQTDFMERDLRKEAIDRLAWGLDMPPEALKGLGNSNHWAALQILGDMWKSHGAPLAEQFCDELGGAYLQPALREAGYPDWNHVVVTYDASAVTAKADRSDDANNAAKYAMISPKGYREMVGIPQDWAPTEKERLEWLQVLGRNSPTQPRQPQQPDQSANGNDPSQGPPPPGPEGDSGRRTRVVTSSAFAYEAMGAAMMALARCRELAGIRLWQKQKSCPECFERASGIPHALVAATLGPAVVAQIGQEPMRLVRGGTAMFQDLLEYWDYSAVQATALCELIEQFAARTLFDERLPQLPSGFAAHLERAKEVV